MSCTTPIEHEQLVAYWANDLDAETSAQIEDHLFACASCLARTDEIARIVQAFRAGPPPVISRDALAALYAQGASIAENTFVAGERKEVHFEAHLDLLVHHLAGLPLADAERVDIEVHTRGTTAISYAFTGVPFDRERGEVLIACQRHFGPFPADVLFHVHVHRRGAPATTATFDVPHLGP